MAKYFYTKNFFQQIPSALLARYFHERNLLQYFDFSVMKEGNPSALFEDGLSQARNQF